jgi:hypothetical protein
LLLLTIRINSARWSSAGLVAKMFSVMYCLVHGYRTKQRDRIFSIVAPCPISQILHAYNTVAATIVSESPKSPIFAPTISFRISYFTFTYKAVSCLTKQPRCTKKVLPNRYSSFIISNLQSLYLNSLPLFFDSVFWNISILVSLCLPLDFLFYSILIRIQVCLVDLRYLSTV